MAPRRFLIFVPLLGTVAVIVWMAWIALAPGCADIQRTHPGLEPVVLGGETFHLELSATPSKRLQGMMYRTSIRDDGGMLFVFPDVDERSFWMLNCLVDMDILYLDPSGKVVSVHEMKTQPPRQPDETEYGYQLRMHANASPSNGPAQFAIELKAGTARRLGIEKGDRIELDLPRLKAKAY